MDTATRKEQILQTAGSMFSRLGYHGTTMRDIARELNIQGGSLYAHIESKEDVLWAIVERAATRFEEAADRADQELSPAAGAADRIAALVRAHVAVVTSESELASVFANEWRHLTGGRRQQVLARRDAYERRLRSLIEDGMASGEILPTDAAVAAAFILTALNGLATWYDPAGRLAPDRLADHYATLAVRALTEDPR